jgi:hypothetical protein
MPTQARPLDLLVGGYLGHLWTTGEGRGRASDILAAIRDLQLQTKGALPLPVSCLQSGVHLLAFRC